MSKNFLLNWKTSLPITPLVLYLASTHTTVRTGIRLNLRLVRWEGASELSLHALSSAGRQRFVIMPDSSPTTRVKRVTQAVFS